MIAAITINFDPLLHLGDLTIRWQTIGVTVALLAALTVAALMAPRIDGQRRRLTEMPLIIAGIVPGAVVGGRLVHVLAYWDAYAAEPARMVDPTVGSLSLTGAVIFGFLSGGYVAQVLRAPVGRWMDGAAVPLLFAIGLGKFAQLLGGSGQGMPFDGPWAVTFASGWPWVSTDPDLPSHPAQVYEGLWALIGIPIVLLLSRARRQPTRVDHLGRRVELTAVEGRLFDNAVAWFLLGRVVVGFTWRDDRLLGLMNAEQVIALALLVSVLLLRRLRRRPGDARSIVSP